MSSVEAQEEAVPQDYQALAELGRGAGDPAESLRAWEAAEALGGPTLEVLLGEAGALARLDRLPEAREAAKAAALAFPDAAAAWTARADLAEIGAGSPLLAATIADPWRLRAMELDPTDATRCAAAASALARGDRAAARERLGNSGALCPEIQATLADRWEAWGGAWAVGAVQTGTEAPSPTAIGAVQAGGSFDRTISADATLRLGTQRSLWLGASAERAGTGASLLGGLRWSGDKAPPLGTIGGRLWGTRVVTGIAEGAWSRREDGSAFQAAGLVSAPLSAGLRVSGGAQYSATLSDAGELDGGFSGIAGLSASGSRWGVDLTGRFGEEHQAIRLSDRASFDDLPDLGSSFDLRARANVGAGLWLSGGYGAAALEEEGVLHSGWLGFTYVWRE